MSSYGRENGEAAAVERAKTLTDAELRTAAEVLMDMARAGTAASPYTAGYCNRLIQEAYNRRVIT